MQTLVFRPVLRDVAWFHRTTNLGQKWELSTPGSGTLSETRNLQGQIWPLWQKPQPIQRRTGTACGFVLYRLTQILRALISHYLRNDVPKAKVGVPVCASTCPLLGAQALLCTDATLGQL